MDSQLIQQYKHILGNLLNALVKEQVPHVLDMLERIDDDGMDLRRIFDDANARREAPRHWIGILRFIRFGLGLKNEIMSDYETFIAAYQTLSSREGMSTDERQMIQEIGDYLQKADELTGNHGHVNQKLISLLHDALVDTYGLQPDPNDEFYKGVMPEEWARVLVPLLNDTLRLCEGMLEQIRIHAALERMRKLLL